MDPKLKPWIYSERGGLIAKVKSEYLELIGVAYPSGAGTPVAKTLLLDLAMARHKKVPAFRTLIFMKGVKTNILKVPKDCLEKLVWERLV